MQHKQSSPPIQIDQLIEGLSTAVLVIDGTFYIRYANIKAGEILGIAPKKLLDASLNDCLKQFTFPKSRIIQCINDRQSFTASEESLVTNNAKHSFVQLTLSPFISGTETFALLEIIPFDTQRKLSQESHQLSQHLAARELVRGLAHEIKNPLGGIRGAAQLLSRSLPSSELTEFTQLIIEQSDRLQQLVDRLLGPNKPPEKQLCNVHQIIESVRQLILLEDQKSLDVIRDYDPSLPDINIDPALIQQAVLNIARNAMHALQPEGTLTFITRCTHFPGHTEQHLTRAVMVKIIDNGPGIPQNIRDTLFYPMVSGKENGTGLGLSIAQMLIHQHLGKIECESWPGHTEFTIYLPLTEDK